MKTKLIMMVAMAAACATTQLTAMPTEEEMRLAEPVVKKQLASEQEALKSGRKTRSEVAVTAMKLADEADTDAAKLLLMKGAFVLYVRDGKLEKAVETMKALKAAIADMPPQIVNNIIETALLGVAKKEDGARLYKLLDGFKADVAPRGLAAHVKPQPAFALNAAPGSITELNLGNVSPLQFVYCPAGKFSMGYKKQPALSKVKDVEITSPFWVSKTPIRADQLEALGLNSITNAKTGAAVITDASIVVQKLPFVLKERFGKMLPPGYVFRLPTEAEFEYLQKAETKDGDAPTNIWGVDGLYSGGLIGLLDRAPAYGRGVDVVNRKSRGKVWTDLEKVSYENQPDKDPVGWSDDPNWGVFRRRLARNCGGGKLITSQRTNKLYGFYFVVAPDIDKLNKFYWK